MSTTVISASAGAGKTYSLTEKLVEAIRDKGVRPEAVVAITYTNKAAAELARRLRRKLLDAGMAEHAARVRDGYLGTVHSVCQRILGDLAFEAGVSPYPAVAPEAWLKQVASDVVGSTLGPERLATLLPRVEALSLNDTKKNDYRKTYSWRDALDEVLAKARENGLEAEHLHAGADASVAELLALLPARRGDADLNARLRAAIAPVVAFIADEAQAEIDKKGKMSGTTVKRQQWLDEVSRALSGGRRPSWKTLTDATKHFGPKKYTVVAADLLSLVTGHVQDPTFQDDLEQTIREVFGAAAQVQETLQTRKREERIVDFSDMLADAATLLQSDAARARFDGNLDLLMVDEFQDTSPVQLEIIARLASMARETVWVGDGKQAIYGFQGSDPELMQAATAAALDGRAAETRDLSFRSRPDLVRFASELFVQSLAPHGVPEREVRLQPACPESPEMYGIPVLQLWNVVGSPGDPKPKPKVYEGDAIARQVQKIVEDGVLIRKRDRPPAEVADCRAAQYGDIAVLARTNHECRQIALRLDALGIPSRVAEEGLGDTEEAWLLRAGLALLANPSDRLAAAELCWLTGSVDDPSAWLTDRIRARSQAKAADQFDVAFATEPMVQAVRAMAETASQLTPEEAVLALYEALDVPAMVLTWPDPRRRLANLESLRAVARTYEDTCAARRSAATVAGLVGHLGALPTSTAQAMPTTEDAVRVLTYHKCKGLEWPVVICANLGKRFPDSYFSMRVQAADQFDATDPLAGRELRWFPWPYGGKSANLELADIVAAEPFADLERRRRRAERARLLYVGFTRARDHLVLCATTGKTGATDWLDELTDADENPVLSLPWDQDGRAQVVVGGLAWDCDVHQVLGTPVEPAESDGDDPTWFVTPEAVGTRLAQAVRPSEAVDAPGTESIAEVVSIGERLPLTAAGDHMAAVGDTLHGFFAADPGPEDASRSTMASELIDHAGLAGKLATTTVLAAADRFRAWLDAHAPGQRLPEWPVRQRLPGGRFLSGDIDLLVPMDSGWLLVDHKSFPGNTAMRDERVGGWAAQLGAYKRAVETATGLSVKEVWVHLPIRGEVVRLSGV